MNEKEADRKRQSRHRNKKKDLNKRGKEEKKEESSTSVKKKSSEDTLPSNWSKYEITEHSDEEQNESANFETLLDKPVSQGSHFKFKNEEDWSNNVEFHVQFQKYFTLDINLLNVGIACVPFTKRHGFDSPILKTLDENTEKNVIKYQNYLNKKYPEQKSGNKKIKDESVKSKDNKDQGNSQVKKVKTLEEIFKEHLNVVTPTIEDKSESNINNEKKYAEASVEKPQVIEPVKMKEPENINDYMRMEEPVENDQPEINESNKMKKIELPAKIEELVKNEKPAKTEEPVKIEEPPKDEELVKIEESAEIEEIIEKPVVTEELAKPQRVRNRGAANCEKTCEAKESVEVKVQPKIEEIIKTKAEDNLTKTTEIKKPEEVKMKEQRPKVKINETKPKENIKYNKKNETQVPKSKNKNKNETECDELDSLLKLDKNTVEEQPLEDYTDTDPMMESTLPANKNVVSNSAADLEQWLDDFLDD